MGLLEEIYEQMRREGDLTLKELHKKAKPANEIALKEVDFIYRDKMIKDFQGSYLWLKNVSEGKDNKDLKLLLDRYQTMLVDYEKLVNHCSDLRARLIQAETICESLKGHERVNKILSNSLEKLIEENKRLKS